MAKKQKQKISLGTAIAGLLLNVILLPGLGSLIGRKTQPGILQLIFFLLSIILDFTIIGLIIGIPLGIGMWIWGIVSGVEMVQEASLK